MKSRSDNSQEMGLTKVQNKCETFKLDFNYSEVELYTKNPRHFNFKLKRNQIQQRCLPYFEKMMHENVML